VEKGRKGQEVPLEGGSIPACGEQVSRCYSRSKGRETLAEIKKRGRGTGRNTKEFYLQSFTN
jgi:hypothetical protein